MCNLDVDLSALNRRISIVRGINYFIVFPSNDMVMPLFSEVRLGL